MVGVRVVEEFKWSIAGVEIAGKRWRNGSRRVLALHGWLDNAASFDVLAPLLDADIVALDLAGHGHSYHRTPQATYNIWDDLPDILRTADHLGWDSFHLLGHSRGAIIVTLLATATGRVESSVLLDGLRPDPTPLGEFCDQLGRYLQEHLAPAHNGSWYESPELAVRVRCRATGMLESSARPIVERALERGADGWNWRNDPRVRMASAVKMSPEQIAVVLQRFTQRRHLALLADTGVGAMLKRQRELEALPQLRFETFAGSHHFHMEEPARTLAKKIEAFWRELPTSES